jgi:hypothetical protein
VLSQGPLSHARARRVVALKAYRARAKKQEEARCVQMPALPVPGPARKSRTHSVLYTVGFRTPFRIANAFGEYVFLKKSTNLGREETNQTHTSQRPRGRVVGACRVADAVAHADAAAAAVAFCSQIQNKAVVPFVNPRKRQGASQAQAVRPPHPTHTPGSLGAHSRPGGLCNAGREGRDGRGGAGRGPSMVCVA